MTKKPTNLFGRKGPAPQMPIPQQAGPAPQQINIGPNDITFKPCEQCGHDFYDTCFRQGIVSSLNPKNPSGKDMAVQVPVLICRHCGWEFGTAIANESA